MKKISQNISMFACESVLARGRSAGNSKFSNGKFFPFFPYFLFFQTRIVFPELQTFPKIRCSNVQGEFRGREFFNVQFFFKKVVGCSKVGWLERLRGRGEIILVET